MGRSSAARSVVAAAAVLASALSGQAALAEAVPPGPQPQAVAATPSPSPDVSPSADPTPSPSPSAAPSASPTPSPSAAPSASPSPPAPSPSASPSPSPPVPAPTPTPVPTRQALPAPGPSVAILSSDTLQLSGLRSIAVRSVSTSDGPVKVIELVADASTITGLTLQGPCEGTTRVGTTAAEERATGGLTLDATALQATILGVPIIIAAADLPEGQLALPGISLPPLPTDLGLLSVKLFVLTIQSGAMVLSGARITSAAC